MQARRGAGFGALDSNEAEQALVDHGDRSRRRRVADDAHGAPAASGADLLRSRRYRQRGACQPDRCGNDRPSERGPTDGVVLHASLLRFCELWIDRALVRAHEADSFRTGLCSGTIAAAMT
jgi:hypothetical protein